ncbi:hypothetical protein ACLI07_04140 [Providencia huaxiensis]|uniref:DUF7210 family protein n=1 Tax=Providencia huaxiensis TaxID=2027290 RepID=UPI003D2CAAA6
MQTLILLQPHTHAGKFYAEGESLRVDAATQAWLEAQHIVKPPSTPKSNVNKKTIEESAIMLSPTSTVSHTDEKGEH